MRLSDSRARRLLGNVSPLTSCLKSVLIRCVRVTLKAIPSKQALHSQRSLLRICRRLPGSHLSAFKELFLRSSMGSESPLKLRRASRRASLRYGPALISSPKLPGAFVGIEDPPSNKVPIPLSLTSLSFGVRMFEKVPKILW